ncbi:MAG: GNAT family N-acetyltransferase [Candidatus Saccharibacteria bacterium]
MSDLAITLRYLKKTDTDLSQIAAELNAADWEASVKDFSAVDFENFLKSEDRYYLIASIGTEIVGAIHGYKLLHPTGVTYMYIDEVDTMANHRRKGIAKAMMVSVLELAKDWGCAQAWLGTEHDNEAAKALYMSLEPFEIENGPIYSYKVGK